MKVDEMYKNALNNSIGNDKKVKKNFKKKFFAKLPIAMITGVLIAMSVTGCGLIDKQVQQNNPIYEDYMNITEDYGVTTMEVNNYQGERLYKLLDGSVIDKYEARGRTRDYYATAEDYARVNGLDETYLGTMYYTSSKEDANEMAKALGYASLDEYLIKNGFIDSNGDADYRLWSAANSINMAKMMTSEKETNKGGNSK